MHLKEFQQQANKTDQVLAEFDGEPGHPNRHEIVPLIGLVGEVGALLGEYKKQIRDGGLPRKFGDEVEEELGDILWYVACVASKFGLDLEKIATNNLTKVRNRWAHSIGEHPLYDAKQNANQQIPRTFAFRFEERTIDGTPRVMMFDVDRGKCTGNELTDNAYVDDGYRFHDVMHLAFAAQLGWSPVIRKMLRTMDIIQNRPPPLDDAEDGGRAQVVEEAIVAAAYAYTVEYQFLDGIKQIDWQLLRHIKKITRPFEVKDRSNQEWNHVLVQGFKVWGEIWKNKGGVVNGDLNQGTLTFTK